MAAVRAPEQPHASRQEHRAGPGCTDAQGMRVHHAFGICIAADTAFEVRLFGQAQQVLTAVIQVLPPSRLRITADFQAGVYFLGLLGSAASRMTRRGIPC